MKIKYEEPPIWASVKTAFDFNEKTTIFTFGDTIYNPAGLNVTEDLQVHEGVHEKQQAAMNVMGKLGPARWWKKYIKDPEFRFEQELEAYRAQYKFAARNIKGREQLHQYCVMLARHLMGPMYGNLQKGGLFEIMRLIKLSPNATSIKKEAVAV